MSDYCEEKSQGHGGITFGKVVAGAAVVAGAVLLASAVFSGVEKPGGISDLVTGLVNRIGGLFGTPTMGPAAQAALGGAALIGGGAFLNSSMNSRAEALHEQALACGDPVPGGHAEKVQMAAIQSMMQGRMMAASPQFMGAAGPAMG